MSLSEQGKKKYSRRDILKGTAASIAMVTTGSILASCAPKTADTATVAVPTAAPAEKEAAWYGTAPEIADSDIVETVQTEILVCGAGHAGKMAALVAAEQGAKTLVIEKNPTTGPWRTFVGAVGTKAQNAAGVKIDKNEIVLELARYGSNHVNQKLIRVWADESGETVDWLADQLSEYGITHVSEYDTGGDYHGIFKAWATHTKFLGKGDGIVDPMGGPTPSVVKKSEKYGAVYRYNTSLVKLIREGGNTGKVTGAIAKNKEGKYIKINASKGIILCTGGYADDADLFNRLNPPAASVTTLKMVNPGNVGDGIKAGIWAGSVKDEYPAAMLFDRGITNPGGKAGLPFKVGGFNDFLNMGSQPFMKVNMDGKRYCCETTPYDFSLYPLQNEKNGVFVMIWDANYWQNMEAFHTYGCSRMVPSTSVPATGEGMGKEMTDSTIANFIKSGMIIKADTLDELATKLKLPVDTFKATVDRYNKFAAAGVDDDFGKPAKDIIALNTPPYYGATVGAWVLTTMDGLRINPDMQVMDADFKVIEGLYAAGDVAGGFFAHNYPELAIGVACGKSMTFARHAALHILGKI
jgi:hypothetical protein